MSNATKLQIQLMDINTISGSYWYFPKELADTCELKLSGVGKALKNLVDDFEEEL